MRRDERPIVVYKIGGSLFELPDLFERLNELFRNERTRPLVVAGGGGAADIVREWDRVHGLGEHRSHRLAIVSLSLGSAFLAEALGATIVSDRSDANAAWLARRIAVLDVAAFLKREVSKGATPLPASWHVTSDSIAAWVAEHWPARLTLLKSASPERVLDRYVDPYFERASAALSGVEWIDLRGRERGCFSSAASAQGNHRSMYEKAVI